MLYTWLVVIVVPDANSMVVTMVSPTPVWVTVYSSEAWTTPAALVMTMEDSMIPS